MPTQISIQPDETSGPELVSELNPFPIEVVAPVPAAALPATYRAAFSFAAVSGDALVIFGVTGKVIKITEIGIAKPSASETVQVILRRTADSGGTSTLATNVPLDPNDTLVTT